MIQNRGIGMTSQRTRDRLISRLQEQGIKNQQVLSVIRSTPRHLYVDEALASRAYEDTPLPIGHGQTISQPYIVARMTEVLLEEGAPKKVLEIGTGSGYQASILSPLVGSVYTVERISALYESARKRFQELKLNNVFAKHSDGSWGWPAKAPFDAIIVTAAPEHIPESLFEQLAIGGRLIVPVGAGDDQSLQLFKRTATGIEQQELCKVRFVPLLAGAT